MASKSIAFALVALLLCVMSCASETERRSTLVNVMTQSDRVLLRQRPALVQSKYAKMAEDVYSFYRGSLAIHAHDSRAGTWGAANPSGLWAFSMGDAHIENFGLLQDGSGTLSFQPNDFDAAEVYPVEWDLRRLIVSLILAEDIAFERETSAERIEHLAEHVVRSYYAELSSPSPLTLREPPEDSPHLVDLFRRGRRDLRDRAELEELTTVEAARRFVREESGEDEGLFDLPASAHATLSELLAQVYGDVDAFQLKDAVRELGGGVASRPRVRLLLLVEGETASNDDDIVLELKELSPGLAPLRGPPLRRFATIEERFEFARNTLLSDHDVEPLWRASTWLGLPVQLRREAESQKSIKVSRFEDERAEPEAVDRLGQILAQVLARMHAKTLSGMPVVSVDADALARSESSIALRAVLQVRQDFELWRTWVLENPVFHFPTQTFDTPSSEASRFLLPL